MRAASKRRNGRTQSRCPKTRKSNTSLERAEKRDVKSNAKRKTFWTSTSDSRSPALEDAVEASVVEGEDAVVAIGATSVAEDEDVAISEAEARVGSVVDVAAEAIAALLLSASLTTKPSLPWAAHSLGLSRLNTGSTSCRSTDQN